MHYRVSVFVGLTRVQRYEIVIRGLPNALRWFGKNTEHNRHVFRCEPNGGVWLCACVQISLGGKIENHAARHFIFEKLGFWRGLFLRMSCF